MTETNIRLYFVVLAGLTLPAAGGLRGQDGLDQAVQSARVAWSSHDVRALVAAGDTILLGLPGRDVSPPLPARQAARLLEDYLGTATELAFTVKTVRLIGPGRAYAEIERRFVVRGTSDEVKETLFLGFRLISGRWLLREIRVAN